MRSPSDGFLFWWLRGMHICRADTCEACGHARLEAETPRGPAARQSLAHINTSDRPGMHTSIPPLYLLPACLCARVCGFFLTFLVFAASVTNIAAFRQQLSDFATRQILISIKKKNRFLTLKKLRSTSLNCCQYTISSRPIDVSLLLLTKAALR